MDALASAGRLESLVLTAPPPESVDETVERWLREFPDLRKLLAGFGVDLERDDRIREALAALEANVVAEIPDLAVFSEAVAAAAAASASSPLPVAGRELLEEVRRLLPDASLVAERLNRNPVRERLPFIEAIPIVRGSTGWRTPVNQTKIRKRPRDLPQFLASLDTLRALLPDPGIQSEGELLRRAALRGDGYVPLPLDRLRQRVEAMVQDPRTEASVSPLRSLVRMVVEAERENRKPIWMRAAWRLSQYRYPVPSLDRKALLALLAPPCAEFEFSLGGWRSRKQCSQLRGEIEAGAWSAPEIQIRLRELARQGGHVPTVAFLLLDPERNARPERASTASVSGGGSLQRGPARA